MSQATNRLSNEAISWWKRVRRPTKRGRRFIHNVVIRQMTDRAAAIDAGYAPSVAANTRKKIWNQAGIQAHFQSLVLKLLPPERLARVYDELLEGRKVETEQTQERVIGEDGKSTLQVVSVTRKETIDRGVQLRALELAVKHGGLVPSSIRVSVISQA